MFEKVLEETSSPISGKIKVVSFFANKRIMVGGLVQSGGLLEGIWRRALSAINHQPLIINHCLILGLGGGTLAKLISQKWPKAKITGVEIDKEIIRLGKKYFALDKIPKLKIINDDAIKFVKSHQSSIINHQLIFLDLYLGREFPAKFEKQEFLIPLKKLLAQDGLIIINRLFSEKEKNKVKDFIRKLEKVFSEISLFHSPPNLLIFLRKG